MVFSSVILDRLVMLSHKALPGSAAFQGSGAQQLTFDLSFNIIKSEYNNINKYDYL